MVPIKKEIFRAYDIRGIYPTELNEYVALSVAQAFGTLLHKKGLKTVALGCDSRESSLPLVTHFVDGLLSTGINVINTGITVQPAIHYFTFLDGIDAAVNITASHNPGMFNGIKIDLKHARPLFGERLMELHDIAEKGKFTKGSGIYSEEDLNAKYIEYISSKFKLKKQTKVIVYCGNGATSDIYPAILRNIGADVVPLRCYIDTDFPAGLPNPESANFEKELRAQVLESHAKIGLGFDGDGDRLGVMDEKGNLYKTDELFLLFIKEMLQSHPGATIAYDVKCSQLIDAFIRAQGGNPKMLRTGRSYILEEIFGGKILAACELSGHTYFRDEYFGYDDGIYAACRLLRLLDKSKDTLFQMMQEFPKMESTPELKVNCPDEKKFMVIDGVAKDVEEQKFLEINKTDGVRVKISQSGWFLIRASNTSPYLSVRAEGKDKKELLHALDIVAKLLAKHSLV